MENYLDIQNNSSSAQLPSPVFNEAAANDLSAYFARRKQQKYVTIFIHLCTKLIFAINYRPKKMPLFKFDSSAHAKGFGSPQRESAPNSVSSVSLQLHKI